MPKNKTHSGASKRFKVTGSGKVLREHANSATCSSTSPSRATRRSPATSRVAPADAKKIKKLLGN